MTAPASHITHASGRDKLVAHLAMILFSALVAGSFSFGAIAGAYLEPAPLNAARFAIGAAIMGGVCIAMLGRIPKPRAPWRFVILGALMALFFITMFMSLKMTTPVSSGAVFTLMPLMAAFFGWLFLGQVPRALVMISLLVAASGALWVIFRGDLAALAALDIGRGELIFLAGVAGHAAYAPLVRRFNRGEPLVAFTFWSLVAIGSWIAIWGARDIVATDWTATPLVAWATIIYLAIFTTALTTFLVQFATMRLPASKVLAYNYLTPGFIILIEGVLGHGWAAPTVLIGAAITVGGLLVMALAPD